ncbi:MAG: hypothetical protein JSU04_13795 [Bdellovibrionales bacterium]|nr:hypothetical protein [Bdellovibrionales bacterium]
MKIFIHFIGAFLLGTASVHAVLLDGPRVGNGGPRVGNGGVVLICKNRSGQATVQLLDHYEASKRQWTLDLGSPKDHYFQKVAAVIDSIQRLNPSRAALYQEWLASFEMDTYFTDAKLNLLKDTGEIDTPPKGCDLAQAAVHQDTNLRGDRRYIINKGIWNKLDNNGKAGLVLHEMIYRELVTQYPPHGTSYFARSLNAFFSSREVKTMHLQEYYNNLSANYVATMDTQYGLPIVITTASAQGEFVHTKVRFSSPDTVDFAETAAPILNGIFYTWLGNKVILQNGECSEAAAGRYFNAEGAPTCLDALVNELTIQEAGINGKLFFKDGSGYLTNIRESFVSVDSRQVTIRGDGDPTSVLPGPLPVLVFKGTVNGKDVTLEGSEFVLDFVQSTVGVTVP